MQGLCVEDAMRDTRMVDTRGETAIIGLVAAGLLLSAGVGVVHIGSHLEREWIRLPPPTPAGQRPPGDWVTLAPAREGFQVSLPWAPGPWVDPERSATHPVTPRRGYRLVELASADRDTAHEYTIVITSSPEGGLLDRGHPLPAPMLEAVIAAAALPTSRVLGRRPLMEAGCSGYEVTDVHREAGTGDIYTRRQLFWSGPHTYAFAFSSSNRADLTGIRASRFFGSITITR
jgi:hypothetical protein